MGQLMHKNSHLIGIRAKRSMSVGERVVESATNRSVTYKPDDKDAGDDGPNPLPENVGNAKDNKPP
jgi:hypothetical protein